MILLQNMNLKMFWVWNSIKSNTRQNLQTQARCSLQSSQVHAECQVLSLLQHITLCIQFYVYKFITPLLYTVCNVQLGRKFHSFHYPLTLFSRQNTHTQRTFTISFLILKLMLFLLVFDVDIHNLIPWFSVETLQTLSRYYTVDFRF